MAELVDDPKLTAEPLAHPGKVTRRLRGTAEEQLAALPPEPPERGKGRKPAAAKAAPKRKARPSPPPDRDQLDDAEQVLAAAEARFETEEQALAKEEAALVRRRRDLRKARESELARLANARNRAKQAYDQAARKWRANS